MTARYFTATDYHPAALLRRVDFVDEAFVNGAWRPTQSIVDWMYGHDDFVDQISEEQARAFAPAAFTGGHQEEAMTTQYFTSSISGALFRRVSGADHVFAQGTWRPTEKIMRWMVGDEDDVETVTEIEARKIEPTAFTLRDAS